MKQKKRMQSENSFSVKLHQQVIKLVQSRYPDSRSSLDKLNQALIALICCGQYLAVSMPGHGDLTALMSRMAFFFTLWVPTVVLIHPEVERFVRIAVARPKFCPPQVLCKKTRGNISELRLLPNKRMESGFSAIYCGVA